MTEQEAIERLRARADEVSEDEWEVVITLADDLRALLDAYDALETVAQGLAVALGKRRSGFCMAECCKDATAALRAWEAYQRDH